jgi:hypothetical protein
MLLLQPMAITIIIIMTITLLSNVAVSRSQWPARYSLSNTGIVGSNPTRDMHVCVHLFYVSAAV